MPQPTTRRRYGALNKTAVATTYVTGGYPQVQREWGSIPLSTVKDWATALGCGLPLRAVGRLGQYTAAEEK